MLHTLEIRGKTGDNTPYTHDIEPEGGGATMPLKNILVHLDHHDRCAVRLELAVSLAKRFDAHLVGLFAELGQPHKVGVVATWPSDAYREAAAASEAAFTAATSGLKSAKWRDANRGAPQEVTHAIIEAVRNSDLSVLGQDTGDAQASVPCGMAEQVVLHSGRPVLVIPYAGSFNDIGQRPLIAWNHGREAARALNDALPLIKNCNNAVIVSFSARPDDEKAAARDVVAHLGHHGVKAAVEVLSPEGIGVMDLLLNRVTDVGADLLVMGAHGHLGFPYLHRGGGTRHILAHMTVPVLLSH